MSIIKAEVEEALQYFKPSRSVYKIGPNWNHSSIYFNKRFYPESDRDDFVTKLIKESKMQEIFNPNTKKHELYPTRGYNSDRISGYIRHEMLTFFPAFIRHNHDSKNYKLTSLFRWYNMAIDSDVLHQLPDLEKDLWNIFKWLKTETNHSRSNPITRNAISLLDIIRQRYEAKGIKP